MPLQTKKLDSKECSGGICPPICNIKVNKSRSIDTECSTIWHRDMVTEESLNTEARGARYVVAKKHSERHVDRQDTDSDSATASSRRKKSSS